MDRTADLSAALEFVYGRIEEQAMRSGEPLNEEHRFLLKNLPEQPRAWGFDTGGPLSSADLVPRDTVFERLCAVAKAAHGGDLELNPGSPDWEFAFNVSKLNQHPMCWLLQWAGVKQRRPWWDRWLLVISALLVIVSAAVLMLLVINEPTALWRWIAVAAGFVTIVLLIYVAARKIEERQLERNIERCRSASRFAGTLAR